MYRPLGLCALSAYVRKFVDGVHPTVVDMACGEQLPDNADIYGWSCTSVDYETTLGLAHKVAEMYPSAEQIIGGPHASACADEIDPVFDAVFTGEGEVALGSYLRNYSRGLGRTRFWPGQETQAIDGLPFPDRPWQEDCAVIMASRGCPHRCAFCATGSIWHKHRLRSPHGVVAEMDALAGRRVESFNLSDDTPALFREWGMILCKLLRYRGYTWRAQARVDQVSAGMLGVLRASGCRELCFGVESFDQHVLDALHKHTQVRHITKAIRLTHAAGIKTRLYMMISTPGESHSTVALNIEGMESVRDCIDHVTLQTFVALPGTPVRMHPERYGIEIVDDRISNACLADKGGETPVYSTIEIVGLNRDRQLENIRVMREYVRGINNA